MNHKSGITNYQSHRLIKVYYKSRQNYHKKRQFFFYYKLITSKFFQIATGITNYDKIITEYDSYYKLRQLLQIKTEDMNQRML